MSVRPLVRLALLCAAVAAGTFAGGVARAEGPVPPPTELPQVLTLDEALHIFRTRGLGLLIADANVRSAEGAIRVAGAMPNPVLGASWTDAFTYHGADPSCGWGKPGTAAYGPPPGVAGAPGNYAKCGNWG